MPVSAIYPVWRIDTHAAIGRLKGPLQCECHLKFQLVGCCGAGVLNLGGQEYRTANGIFRQKERDFPLIRWKDPCLNEYQTALDRYVPIKTVTAGLLEDSQKNTSKTKQSSPIPTLM